MSYEILGEFSHEHEIYSIRDCSIRSIDISFQR